MTTLDTRHQVVCARELAYAAGVPLRDRYGYAASDEDVLAVLNVLRENGEDFEAAQAVGMANALGDVQLCVGYDAPLEELQELRLVETLRPLVTKSD